MLEKSQLVLDFAMPVPLETGCTIIMTLPVEFTQVSSLVGNVYAYGMFGFMRSLPFTVANSTLTVRDACTSYSENSLRAKIRIANVVNPSSVRETSAFTVTVFDSAARPLAQTKTILKVAASEFAPATLAKLTFSASNDTVQEKASLAVAIVSKNKLSASAMIQIELPKQLSLAAACTAETITA